MTGQTLRIIKSVVAHNRLVGIMTGQAADAMISPVKAFAVRETVRLEASVNYASPAPSCY